MALKRGVFKDFLKQSSVGEYLITEGRAFHRCGAETEKG